jgi:hypothetical protein
MFFKTFKRQFKGHGEFVCCLIEAILKYYWRVLNVILNKSPKIIISPICFQLNSGENDKYNISSRNILKVKKLLE